MKHRGIRSVIILALLLLLGFGCEEKATGPEPGPPSPPPDTGNAGVIAYCYEPTSGDNLKESIYTINADGSGNTEVMAAPVGLNYPDWSPDGEKLAVLGYVSDSTWSIYAFDADGTNLVRLTAAAGVWDGDPAWSPNGTQIVFTRIYPSQNYRAEIWTMDAGGGNQSWTGIEGGSARWSPDGARLVYHAMKTDNYEIYACDIDGSNEQQLTFTAVGELAPAWSPDGSNIAMTVVTAGAGGFVHQIFVMDSDGSNRRALTDEQTGGANPRWSPDGLSIAFKSHGDIYIINADGPELRQLTNSPADAKAINPAWKPES